MVWTCRENLMLMADVSGGWVRGNPRLGWMDRPGYCEGDLGQRWDGSIGCATISKM